MWLIAGLGNPGSQYLATRHNIGFMAVDALAGPEPFISKFHAEISAPVIEGEKLLLLKPQTFMNHSGRAVQAALSFYKIPPTQLVVLHDELDLPLGKIRIKRGGGANGHNGIRDIDQCIGPDYWRVRMGIGHPGDKMDVHAYVLGKFTREEQALADTVNAALAKHMAAFWQHSPEMLATRVAETLNPPKPRKAAVDKPPQSD